LVGGEDRSRKMTLTKREGVRKVVAWIEVMARASLDVCVSVRGRVWWTYKCQME
jgi:hypothetical protein